MTETPETEGIEFEVVVEDEAESTEQAPAEVTETASLDLAGIERGHRMQAVVKHFIPEGVDLEEEMKHVNLKMKPDGSLDGDVYYRPPQAAAPQHPLAGNAKGHAIVNQRIEQATKLPGEDYAQVRDSIREAKRAMGLLFD